MRSGAERDPLEGMLGTLSVDQYENFMFNLDEPVPLCVDFFPNGDKQITPGLLSGKSDEIHLICLLLIRLWVY